MDFSVFMSNFGSHFSRMRTAHDRIRSRISDFMNMDQERQAVASMHDDIIVQLDGVATTLEILADLVDVPVVEEDESSEDEGEAEVEGEQLELPIQEQESE